MNSNSRKWVVANKIIGDAIDVALILIIQISLYFHYFIDSKNAKGGAALFIYLRLAMLVVAMFTLPFRGKRHPRIVNFVLFDGQGNRRTTFIVPGMCAAIFMLTSLCGMRLASLFVSEIIGK